MQSSDISSLGLIFDIGGATLLWRFGLPEVEVYRSGRIPAVYNPASPEQEKKIQKYDRLAKLAVVLLTLGFVLQLIGTEWPRFFPHASAFPSSATAPQ
ncbi:MAG: hypothetical protein H7343_23875 [Undibacterium sp.]|nr:hypothetical protein [Opitutaceae bacterium]